jgi:hypothetical protein
MVDLTITIPNNKVELVKKALGYQETIIQSKEDGTSEEVPNPETAAQYAERLIIEFLKQRVKAHERREAIKAIQYSDVSDIQ